LISIVSVPYVVFLSIELFDITYVKKEVSMLSISLKMFFVVTVPVIIGMIIRKFANDLIIRNMKIINKISIGLFIIVFVAIYIEEWDSILMFITKAGTIALLLNVTMMVIAFYIAKFFTTGVAQRRCISLEAGLQNGTLAVFVGLQLFGDNMTYMVPTAAYALIMMTTSVIFVLILRRQT
jgi:BASS family bile acid:Na+ symporter